MKLTNLVIALATFATITLSSSAYIATKEVTSAVIVDKAKHSLNLTTNGLYHISLSEAFTIDNSEAEQINFLRCSFSRPEFRFSWYCHQLKIDGKLTKNSYMALKDDQEKYFRENVIKSIAYEARKLQQLAEQASTLSKIQRVHKTAQEKAKASGVNGEARAVDSVEHGGSELMKVGTNEEFRKSLHEINLEALREFNLHDVIERYESSNSPKSVQDFEPDAKALLKNIDKGFLAGVGLIPADEDDAKHAGVGKLEATKNSKIVAGSIVAILLILIIISIVSIIREMKKLQQRLLNGDFNVKLEGGKLNDK
ncbi:hypothetical protein [Pseudomonas fluorescens]|uniref:hypothetical protein n=1 Tax=Pseudomonas fluorescens TaxID=294 RepID=UPI00058A7101|nr:hypothetical protein [Pseudomonas fluorescens]CEL31175.1 hypothetical protein SRM1_04539 [Pseudomonas fluorescens]